MKHTLPTDSEERKTIPLMRGCVAYFPAALAGVASVSHVGNEKHNTGQPMHHNRSKSGDHADCVVRHLIDCADLLAKHERGGLTKLEVQHLLIEASSASWRCLAMTQELFEKFGDAPLAPGAKVGKR